MMLHARTCPHPGPHRAPARAGRGAWSQSPVAVTVPGPVARVAVEELAERVM